MNTVTQTMKFRQSLLSYAEKHEVTQAAIKYNVNLHIFHIRHQANTGGIHTDLVHIHRQCWFFDVSEELRADDLIYFSFIFLLFWLL